MDLKKFGRDWAVADRIIDSWIGGAPLSAIDRDIVLDKLRRIYEEVCAADYIDPIPEPEPEPEPQPVRRELPADDMIAEIDGAAVADDTDPVYESDAPTGKTKIDRRALLSLYDDPMETATPAAVQADESLIPPIGDMADEPARDRGGIADNDGWTIADAYAGSVHDLASELSSGPVESLREAIGVNDKFCMVRDMFGSDVEAYERAIAEFESFTDLDDAMVYMYENFSWNPNDESVRMLVDLLTRKLA